MTTPTTMVAVSRLNSVRRLLCYLTAVGISIALCGCVSAPKTGTINALESRGSTRDAAVGWNEVKIKLEQSVKRLPRETVTWAGVAFSGRADQIAAKYPRSSAVLDELNREFRNRISECRPANFNTDVSSDASSFRPSRDALSFGFIIDQERLRIEPWGEKFVVDVAVLGRIVFMDLQQQAIVASYGLETRSLDLCDSKPDEKFIANMVRNTFFSKTRANDGAPVGILDQFCNQLNSSICAPRSPQLPIGIGRVRFGSGCESALDAQQLRQLEDTLQSSFIGFMGDRTLLAVYPIEDASRATLTATYSDGQILNLRVPEPYRIFDVEIDTMRVVESPANKYSHNISYTIAGRVVVTEPTTRRTKFTHEFDLSPGGSKTPAALRPTYQKFSTRTASNRLFESGKIDHSSGFLAAMNGYLEQFKDELIYPERDLAKRFGPVRQDLLRSIAVRSDQ